MKTERNNVKMSIGGRVKIDNSIVKWLYVVDGWVNLGLSRTDVSIYKNRERACIHLGGLNMRDFVRSDLKELGIIDG